METGAPDCHTRTWETPCRVLMVVHLTPLSHSNSGNSGCYLERECEPSHFRRACPFKLPSIHNCCIKDVTGYVPAYSLWYFFMDLFESSDTVCLHSLLWQQIPEAQSPLCKHCICFKSSPTSFNEFPLVLQDLVDNSSAFTLSAIFMIF